MPAGIPIKSGTVEWHSNYIPYRMAAAIKCPENFTKLLTRKCRVYSLMMSFDQEVPGPFPDDVLAKLFSLSCEPLQSSLIVVHLNFNAFC